MKIAVLLATFNRKEKTLSCLRSLHKQQLPAEVQLEVFLTDDASSDGTIDAVIKEFPSTNIFKGSGSLFWAGGMRNSWTQATLTKPEFYLLLNDDTTLKSFAITTLLEAGKQELSTHPVICVGSTMDKLSGDISYGGHKLFNKNSIKYYNTFSTTEYLECDLANANIMLVPAAIVSKIGILSFNYTHSIADFDYSLRAKEAGYKVIVAPGVLGHCTDDHGNNWKSSGAPLKDRIAYLKSPKGLAYSEYLLFIKTHFPLHLPVAFVKLWMKTLFPVLWDKFKA